MTSRSRSQAQDTQGNIFSRLFDVAVVYSDILDRRRAQALTLITFGLGVAGLIGFTLALIMQPDLLRYQAVSGLIFAVLTLVVFALVRSGYLNTASIFFVSFLLLFAIVQVLPWGINSAIAITLVLPLLTSALLKGGRSLMLTIISTLLAVGGLIYLEVTNTILITLPAAARSLEFWFSFITIAVVLLLTSIIVWFLTSSVFNWARGMQRLSRQIDAAAVVTETTATASNLSDLLNIVVERIREAYGFYHAQVFLLDEEKRLARLEASTGRAGATLLARGHALPVGSQSVIGQCVASREPMVVNNTLISDIHRPNELLPDTRAELAMPLMIGEEVIGVLDVQSTEIEVFQEMDVRSLQVMAGQLATSIEKVRIVDELQARALENERLYEESQRNLLQIEDLSRRLTREGWDDYLRLRKATSDLGYTKHGEVIHSDTTWSATMKQAYQGQQSVVVKQDRNAHIAAVPLFVRGEVIGVLEFQRDGNRPWTDDEIEVAETLVGRLSLAIENARLFEQATLSANREQILNRISQSVQQAGSIEDVLQTALIQLRDILNASSGQVRINPQLILTQEQIDQQTGEGREV